MIFVFAAGNLKVHVKKQHPEVDLSKTGDPSKATKEWLSESSAGHFDSFALHDDRLMCKCFRFRLDHIPPDAQPRHDPTDAHQTGLDRLHVRSES